METASHIKQIEINGVKFEVDLRTAKKIDTFRVGDRVKVLTKPYGTEYRVSQGVIVAFDDFKELPTITVCYLGDNYSAELKFAYINATSKDIEIVTANDDVLVDKEEVVGRIAREIERKEAEIEELRRKTEYFETRFGAWFNQSTNK